MRSSSSFAAATPLLASQAPATPRLPAADELEARNRFVHVDVAPLDEDDEDVSSDSCYDSDDEESPAMMFRQAMKLMAKPLDVPAAKFYASVPAIPAWTYNSGVIHPPVDPKLTRLSYYFHALLTEEETVPSPSELVESTLQWMTLAFIDPRMQQEDLLEDVPYAILHVRRAHLLAENARRLRHRIRDRKARHQEYHELLATAGPQVTRNMRLQGRHQKHTTPLLNSMMERNLARMRGDAPSYLKNYKEIQTWI